MKRFSSSLSRIKNTSKAFVAVVVRRFDNRILLTVGLLATLFVFFSFAIDRIATKKQLSRSDAIMNIRFSGPEPAKDILIVDIDERSLVTLSSSHGNWPWPRDVLADGLQHLADLGVKGILFNVMMSDHDLKHPESDAAMEITAALLEPVSFPLIRLNKKNDSISKLNVGTLPDSKVHASNTEPIPVAAIIPVFKPMHNRLGVSNQRPDDDGIVRRYPFVWSEESFSLPSIVKMTLNVSGRQTTDVPDTIMLNWRNKKGRYQRISFVDATRIEPGSEQALRFKNALVVLGVSAPGIGQVKATAVTAVEDDNEILATAIDDAANGTYFRTIPPWVSLIVSIVAIWALVLLAIIRVEPEKINRIFILLQLSLTAVMLFFASYTYLLIDLSDTMSFVLIVFAAVKLIRTMSDNSARACPGYWQGDMDPTARTLILAGFRQKFFGFRTRLKWEQRAQELSGMGQVIRIDNLFGKNSFLGEQFSDYEALIVLSKQSSEYDLLNIFGTQQAPGIKVISVTLEDDTDIGGEKFRLLLAGLIIDNAAEIYAV